jgi:hypothetical protein
MGDNYLSIANGWGMWLASAGFVVIVFFQAIRISTITFKAGRKIGMTDGQLWRAFRTGLTTSIVPSIAVLLGLALLIPKLGLPFPWMRLSIIGSISYELMAAGIGAGAVVKDGLAGNMNGIAFSCAVWAMCVGCIFNLIMVAFFTPHIMKLKEKIAGGDEGWLKVMTAAAFFGAVGYMVAQPIVKRGSPLVALIGGFITMLLLGAVITVAKQNWLKEWALSLAIIGGMAIAGLAFLWFGIGV